MCEALNGFGKGVNRNSDRGNSKAGRKDAKPKAKHPARSACTKYHISQSGEAMPFYGHCHVPGIVQQLKIYPGVTMMRNNHRQMTDTMDKADRAKRGKVTWFSERSRRAMLIYLGMINIVMRYWQDFTFEDSTMVGKSIAERAKYSTRVMDSWKKRIKRRGWRIEGVWKREWKRRKSGLCVGQFCPHYHCVFDLYDKDGKRVPHNVSVIELARMWIQSCKLKEGTQSYENAWGVLIHEKSFRIVDGRKYMIAYMTKYFTKIEGDEIMDEGDNVESIGRCWGRFDKIQIAEPEVHEMTYEEAVKFNRVMRRKMKWAKGYLLASLKDGHGCYHVFMDHEEIKRYMEYLRKDCQHVEGVPF